MKKIQKICRKLCSTSKYNYYRIIITPSHIEVKISPKQNNGNEVNWVKENDKHSRIDLFYSLQNEYNSVISGKH